MPSIVSRGKTVQQALDIALEMLETTKENVFIEIMEQESRGLLGLGAKQAVVRVTLKEPPVVQEGTDSENIEQALESIRLYTGYEKKIPGNRIDGKAEIEGDLAGKVWIQEGVIRCMDVPNQYPLITPMKNVVLFKNGVQIEKTTTVTERDTFNVEFKEECQPPVWNLSLDDKKMTAVLELQPGFKRTHYLKDQSPGIHLLLSVDEVITPLFIEMQDVLNELEALGVCHGIVHEQIAAACNALAPGSFVVARGQEPLQGTNGYVKPLFQSDEEQRVMPKEREDGTIDFREIKQFPSVREGVVIALVVPPEEGTPGIDVTGNQVPPEPVYDLHLKLGEDVSLLEDGSKIVSLKPGRPRLFHKNRMSEIAIVPKLVHGSDVDLLSGNIHFQGDVEILGSIQDGMRVEADGSVTVRGNVNMAHVNAGQALWVHSNLISSVISVGKGSAVTAQLHPLLSELDEKLDLLRNAVIQISKATAFKATDFEKKGLYPLIKVLLQGKFKLLLEKIYEFNKIISEGTDEAHWIEYGAALRKAFLNPVSSSLNQIKDLDYLYEETRKLLHSVQTQEQDHVSCQFAYALNSSVYCQGDVYIQQGCYNTKLYSGGMLSVQDYLRGGDYYANEGIRVSEVGSVGGGMTKLRVPADAEIHIGKAMEATIIQVGKQVRQLTQETAHVRARLDKDGILRLV